MKVTLKILDRVILGNILPGQGKFDDMILRFDVLEKTSIKQEELTECEIKSTEDGKGLNWNREKDLGVEIDFTEAEASYVARELKRVSDEGRLMAEAVSLYRTFVLAK
jgi:hypothetical protein